MMRSFSEKQRKKESIWMNLHVAAESAFCVAVICILFSETSKSRLFFVRCCLHVLLLGTNLRLIAACPLIIYLGSTDFNDEKSSVKSDSSFYEGNLFKLRSQNSCLV